LTALSVIAFVFGALGVWLTIKQTIWCWPVSLVAVAASVAEFYNERLFGDMALQVFYFGAGVYGWIYWNKRNSSAFSATSVPSRWWIVLAAGTITQAILYYFIISYFRGDRVLLDSVLTAASLTATYMMTRKWTENWLAWVIIDLTYIYLYAAKEMWLFSALCALFAAMAFYGWRQWKRKSAAVL